MNVQQILDELKDIPANEQDNPVYVYECESGERLTLSGVVVANHGIECEAHEVLPPMRVHEVIEQLEYFDGGTVVYCDCVEINMVDLGCEGLVDLNIN